MESLLIIKQLLGIYYIIEPALVSLTSHSVAHLKPHLSNDLRKGFSRSILLSLLPPLTSTSL